METVIALLGVLLVVGILLAIIYIISSVNKKLKDKIDIEKNKIKEFYSRYEGINKKTPEEKDFNELDKLARDLFKDRDDMSYKNSYIELAKAYKEKNQTAKYEFCNQMSKIMYSEEVPTKKEILEVMDLFEKVMKELNLPKVK